MNDNLKDPEIDSESEPWQCDACGAEVSFEDKLCPNCGADISEVADDDEDENTVSGNPVVQAKLKPPAITRGIIILIIGVALIIISPSLSFTDNYSYPGFLPGQRFVDSRTNTEIVNLAFFGGIALLVVGGIISALGFSQFRSTQPTTPPAATTQPIVTQSVSPKSVELGNTPDEVQLVMGQPDKIVNLGARVIHIYKDMKIIYVDGKVADVQ